MLQQKGQADPYKQQHQKQKQGQLQGRSSSAQALTSFSKN